MSLWVELTLSHGSTQKHEMEACMNFMENTYDSYDMIEDILNQFDITNN